jgi:hypothetical protein
MGYEIDLGIDGFEHLLCDRYAGKYSGRFYLQSCTSADAIGQKRQTGVVAVPNIFLQRKAYEIFDVHSYWCIISG